MDAGSVVVDAQDLTREDEAAARARGAEDVEHLLSFQRQGRGFAASDKFSEIVAVLRKEAVLSAAALLATEPALSPP